VVTAPLKPERESVVFHSASGPLPVRRTSSGYLMDFPARFSEPIEAPAALIAALGIAPIEVRVNSFNYMALLPSEQTVHELTPDLAAIARLDRGGVIVTAAGSGDYDFVSRYFAPAKGMPEDPVTGGAHCMLAPYWAKELRRSEFRAYQASRRGGEVVCRLKGERVELEGACVFYMEGTAEI
jgi:predicted PhzF superfamily epimerase YddE/YHI9